MRKRKEIGEDEIEKKKEMVEMMVKLQQGRDLKKVMNIGNTM